ncbi:hypothetical protein CP532_4713, partial [Ophiocordyceps camponoti-leonardi (nom. inval.)]
SSTTSTRHPVNTSLVNLKLSTSFLSTKRINSSLGVTFDKLIVYSPIAEGHSSIVLKGSQAAHLHCTAVSSRLPHPPTPIQRQPHDSVSADQSTSTKSPPTTNHHHPSIIRPLPSIHPPTTIITRLSNPDVSPSNRPTSRSCQRRRSSTTLVFSSTSPVSASTDSDSPRILSPLPLGIRICPSVRRGPGKRIIMAARGPAAPRGVNNRFAQFKLVLLVLRFVKDQFDSFRESTIGAAFLTQTISLDENTTVKFEIWDTAGQERYKSLAPMYYRNANCAVVVYDITQSSSLDKAKAWVKELQRQANENIIIALAGNKLDLVNQQPDKRAIPTNEAEAYAREAGLLFFETSAKTAENVRELFTAIAKKLPLDQVGPRHARPGQRPGVSLNPENANTNLLKLPIKIASLNALHANHRVTGDRLAGVRGLADYLVSFTESWGRETCVGCRVDILVNPRKAVAGGFRRVLASRVSVISEITDPAPSPKSVERSLAQEFAMLRSSLRSARPLGCSPLAMAARRQLVTKRASLRSFSDKKTPGDASETPVLPSSQTLTSQRSAAPHGLGEPKLGAATKLPPTPPTPQEVAGGRDQPPTTIDDVGESTVLQENAPPPPTPPTPPPPRKSFARRLRNLVFSLVLLSMAGFGGGVLYSRSNDNFHDFFTEYIPYGEQAVLYLEEMDYKSKFPQGRGRASQVSGEDSKQVKISAQSGASWRVADSGEPSGRHSNASSRAKESSAPETPKVEPAKAEPTVSEAASKPSKATARIVDSSGKTSAVASKEPEVNEPSKFLALKPIDLMSLPDAKEPIVRDLVRMVNDLILVINADGAHARYGTTMEKAKKDVANVGARLKAMKSAVEQKAAAEVKSSIGNFEKAATDLIRRVEGTMLAQEMEWRKEFEQEMKAVRDGYDERVKVLLEQEKKLNETKVENKLLEQALALKRAFTQEVKSQVEQERKGRLAKLADMSSTVSELEKLMAGWNEVLDSNLKTQQLHVAVEAVRASLEDGQNPRPFIKELVALKEIAADDAVVDAAIGSVNPVAYQRGISTSLQLMDRFRRVASEVRKASLLPDDAGVASHASSWALSHLLFKKQGLAEGDDVESILTRAQTHLEDGDLDSAAREMNGLQGWAKTLSKDWLGEVRKVLEVQQALDVIATEARLQSLRVD